jgi:hypothetical protein
MTDLKEKLRTSNLLSQRNQRALQNESADRIEKLEAALRPFAERAGKLDGKWLDHETHWSPAYGSSEITIGDLRNAYKVFNDRY